MERDPIVIGEASAWRRNMLSGMRIALVLDNPRRDLRGVTLLAYQLAKRGARVFIVPMYQQGYDVPVLMPDVVVANYARENNRDLLATYRALGIQITVLDTEGGVLSESGLDAPDNWARTFRQSGMANLVDRYFFWGEAVYQAFLRESGMESSRLAVTGCPRYDLCAEKWRSVLRYPRRGYVLVNTNFSAVNPAYTRSSAVERAIFVMLGWPEDYVNRLFADLEAVFPRYLDTVANLAAALPGMPILVRPHPFEDHDVYKKRFKGLANLVVDGEGDVLDVIAHAECVVHLNCGTAVETVLLDRIPVSLEFLNTETMRRHAPLPARLSCLAESMDILIELVRNAKARAAAFDREKARSLIHPWFHHNDGNASERVANYLSELSVRTPKRPSWVAAARGGRVRPRTGQWLQGMLSVALGSLAVSTIRGVVHPARRGKTPVLASVRTLLDLYSDCEGRALAFQVHHARHPISRLPLSTIEVVAA